MSLINKMLHDLDRRSGFVAPGGGLPLQEVRPVVQQRVLTFWVRGLVGLVVLAGVGRIAWIAHELRPRQALATDLAFRAESEIRARPAAVPAVAEEPEPMPSESPLPSAEPSAATVAEGESIDPDSAAQAHPPVGSLKLALSIDTPITERQPRVARDAPARQNAAPVAGSRSSGPVVTPMLVPPASGGVERRDRTTTAERTDSQFNSAMNLLKEGRVAEAENALGAVIASNPLDERARQGLVALLLEQRRLEEAVLVLRQGIALNPASTQFGVVLGRILAERQDYKGALQALMQAQPATRNPEFSSLLAAVLQRLGRHQEAADAYRAALEASPGNPGALIGFAISLESLQQRSEALEAYRRALTSASLSPQLRAYAEQKVKELR